MNTVQLTLAIGCVVAIAVGQVLFKRLGLEIEATGTWLQPRAILILGVALAIYGGATLLWIHLLRSVELSRAYPFMALSFVLVPIMSWWLFSEQLSASYLVGTLLIVGGIVVIATLH